MTEADFQTQILFSESLLMLCVRVLCVYVYVWTALQLWTRRKQKKDTDKKNNMMNICISFSLCKLEHPFLISVAFFIFQLNFSSFPFFPGCFYSPAVSATILSDYKFKWYFRWQYEK